MTYNNVASALPAARWTAASTPPWTCRGAATTPLGADPEPREFELHRIRPGPALSTTDKAAEARPLWPTGPRLRSTAAGSTCRPLSCRGPRSCDLVRVSSQGAGRAGGQSHAQRQMHGGCDAGRLASSGGASAKRRALSTAFAW